MKIIITEDRLYEIMKEYLLLNFETLSEPLEVITYWSKGNNTPMKGPIMFGSDPRYDFDYYVKKYEEEDGGEIWFKEFSDNHPYEHTKWEVNDKLEEMFELFGLEAFQNFVKQYFGIDLTEKGDFEFDWVLR